MSVAQNMMDSERRLDTLSHTVKLAAGMLDEGMMNGNIEAPAVPMTPVKASADATKAVSVRRSSSSPAANKAPPTPSAGSNHNRG